MTSPSEHTRLAPVRTNLQRLVLLRFVLVAAAMLGVAAARLWGLPLGTVSPAIWVGVVLLSLNVVTQVRLRHPRPVTDIELFLQLLVDVVLWSIVLAWSGAPHSPLGSFYLLPIVIAAVTLPRRLTWFIALLTMGCYTYLYYDYARLGHLETGPPEHLDLHVMGMWVTFVFSALLIAYFLERMASAIRERDRILADKREEALRDERIVALGTMAVGAAHELGTPLTTMAVIANDLQHECRDRPDILDDIRTLRNQVDECKHIITRMLVNAGHARAEGVEPQRLDDYLDQIVARWQLMRPAVDCAYVRDGPAPIPAIAALQTVSQAIMNLLNNAADASPEHVEIEGGWNEERLRLEIRDRGPGLSREASRRAGEPFFSTKPPGQGIGLGLFLANATIERFGGKVGIFAREGGGACTLVEIPLAPLRAGASA